jgi:hypothetical protein
MIEFPWQNFKLGINSSIEGLRVLVSTLCANMKGNPLSISLILVIFATLFGTKGPSPFTKTIIS